MASLTDTLWTCIVQGPQQGVRAGEEARAAAAAFAQDRLHAVTHLLAACSSVNERISSVAHGCSLPEVRVWQAWLASGLR